MKYDLTQPLADLDGKALELKERDNKPWPMHEAIAVALLSKDEMARGGNFDQDFRRFKIAQNIHKDPAKVDMEAADVTVVKNDLARIFPPLISGQIAEFLESAKT